MLGSMKLGIVGLPNVGKSTLFNAITNAGAEVANYAFCTINPNVGMVSVPDARLDYLAEMYQPKKKTPAVIEFVDIAGLVKGASKGEGLGNKFLSNIRATDAIVHVVRCFDDENVMHVEGSTDPLRDIEIIDLELIMADIEMVQRRIDKAAKAGKSGDKACLHEADVFRGLLEHLNDGKSARTYDCSDEDRALLETSDLLSIKPVIYAANLDENTFAAGYEDCKYYQQVRDLAASQGAQVLPICAKVEQEIGERAMFLEELGIEESGLDRLIQCSYSLLGLISFLTCGSDECRAWTITRGTKAPQAAGKIHSDFERGFIRAEIVAFDDLKACGSMAVAKEKGLVRSEGKDYVMHDGDVTLFRFFWKTTNRTRQNAACGLFLFRCVAAAQAAEFPAQALAEFRRLRGALQQEDAAVCTVPAVGKAAFPDPVAHHEIAVLVRAKGYGLFLLTPDDLPRALQIAGEQFPAAVGAFVAYGHGGALLSVIGWTSRFSIARTACIWQAIRAAFHAQTAAIPAGFRMKLCLTGDNSRCYDDTVQKAVTGLAPE